MITSELGPHQQVFPPVLQLQGGPVWICWCSAADSDSYFSFPQPSSSSPHWYIREGNGVFVRQLFIDRLPQEGWYSNGRRCDYWWSDEQREDGKMKRLLGGVWLSATAPRWTDAAVKQNLHSQNALLLQLHLSSRENMNSGDSPIPPLFELDLKSGL